MKINLQLFAGTQHLIYIYSNDGNTLLFTGAGFETAVITVTSTGVTGFSEFGSDSGTYTYSGQGTFRGLSGTANSTTPDLPIGYSDTISNIKSLVGTESELITLYVVDVATSVTYEHLLKDSHKIQVDSAIRDGNGAKIDTNYEKLANKVTSISSSSTDTQYPSAKLLYDQLALKQNVLSSGVNIKTINNTSILGSGNIAISGSSGTVETYTITTWTALSSSSPYTYQATATATATIGNDTIVELINNQAVLFATYGFAIGSISGQTITIYSIGQPSSSVTLKVKIGG